MTERCFLDSNILLYADDESAGPKQDKAIALLEAGLRTRKAVISTQVLQEYYVNAVKKLKIPPEVARSSVEIFQTLPTALIQCSDILAAIDLQRLHTISFWDCLVIGSATNSRCKILYSEDLQTGREFGNLRIVNPFHAEEPLTAG